MEILIPILIFAVLAVVTGILLTVFSTIFAVPVDEQVERLTEALPGLNCGACGFSGCDGYAKELATTDIETNKCIPGGNNVSEKISSILGKIFLKIEKHIAFVHCRGQVPQNTQNAYDYVGEKTCAACYTLYQGQSNCAYGCIGFGDCAKVCPFGAISIVNELAQVDANRCTGCGTCLKACPKEIITLLPLGKKIHVKCSSHDIGKKTRANCLAGCIGCKKCEKICPNGAITVENSLARIDYDKCTNCFACIEGCPSKCIIKI